MNRYLVRLTVAAALAALPFASHALGTNEKGCLVGGAAGGLAGNLIGGNTKGTLIGGALGCGVGVYANKERVKRIDAEKREKDRRVAAARKRQHAKNPARPDAPRYAETSR
jgi:predicted lipid-binding transport protein (Tim44 family)